jgi:hypothetical protein
MVSAVEHPRPLLSVFKTGATTFLSSSSSFMDPDPDPLLLRKSGSTGNRTRDPCLQPETLSRSPY